MSRITLFERVPLTHRPSKLGVRRPSMTPAVAVRVVDALMAKGGEQTLRAISDEIGRRHSHQAVAEPGETSPAGEARRPRKPPPRHPEPARETNS